MLGSMGIAVVRRLTRALNRLLRLRESEARVLISCLTAGMLLCTGGGPSWATPPTETRDFPPVLIASGEISCGQFIEDTRANNAALTNYLQCGFGVFSSTTTESWM